VNPGRAAVKLGQGIIGKTGSAAPEPRADRDEADPPTVSTRADVGEIVKRSRPRCSGNTEILSGRQRRCGRLAYTGITGRRDADGLLFSLDRKKDVISAGGVRNVSAHRSKQRLAATRRCRGGRWVIGCPTPIVRQRCKDTWLLSPGVSAKRPVDELLGHICASGSRPLAVRAYWRFGIACTGDRQRKGAKERYQRRAEVRRGEHDRLAFVAG